MEGGWKGREICLFEGKVGRRKGFLKIGMWGKGSRNLVVWGDGWEAEGLFENRKIWGKEREIRWFGKIGFGGAKSFLKGNIWGEREEKYVFEKSDFERMNGFF